MTSRASALGLALALAASAGGGCARRPGPSPVARNLVLVTLDTLRADHLGCYGSTEVATPHLDRLAREGARAAHATAHVPLTLPSHVSLFTGRIPPETGVRDNVAAPLDPSLPTLAEVLGRHGFATAGFVSSIVLGHRTGLARGFDTYSDDIEGGTDDARFLNTVQRRGDVTLALAASWLEKRLGKDAAGTPKPAGESGRRDRTFLWLHLYDAHDPYEPPEPFAARYAGRPYDGEVAWIDELVGRLDETLARLGLRENTLLVVTADHGEGLGDHGETLHGYFIYESTLSIPLLVRGPGIPGGTVLEATARTVDLFPTVLDLLGVKAPEGLSLSGRSLAAALRGGKALPEEAAYAESLVPLLHFGWSDLRSIRLGPFKYIQAPRPELYDLARDPGETHNVVASEPGRARALRLALAERLAGERAGPAPKADLSPDVLEKLGALGYLGLGQPPQGVDRNADPKDKLEEFRIANRLVREGLVRLREKDPEGSAARFEKLLSLGIESFEVHYYLARALSTLGRPAEAAPHFEKALAFQPTYAAAYDGLAECRAAEGRPEEAIEVLRRGQRAIPDEPSLYEREGQIWRQRGKLREALAAWEAARARAPHAALLRVRLGELYRDAGESDKAIARLREAVALDPGPASYWNSLGMVLGGQGSLAEAQDAFEKALERSPRDPEYTYNLGLVLLREGRRAEAAERFRRTLEIEPRFQAARDRLAEIAARS